MAEKTGYKTCPFCKEEIRDAAVKCRFCGEWLDGRSEKAVATPPVLPAEPGLAESAVEGGDGGPVVATEVAGAGTVATSIGSGGAAGNYWYGYLYVFFCGYLTYCSASHLLAGALKLAPTGDVQKQTEYWFGLALWACATAFFAYVTYKLSRREANMGLIYTIVTLHGVNVLARGISPGELVIWLVLSWIVVTKFRERKALEDGGATEDDKYELLSRATRLEAKGRVEEALAAYRKIMAKYPDSPAGQDARKSLESLEAKVSR